MEKRPSQKNLIIAVVAVIVVAVLGIAGIVLRNISLNSTATVLSAQSQNDQVFTLDVKLTNAQGESTIYPMQSNVEETLYSVIDRYDINHDDFNKDATNFGESGFFITNFNNYPLESNQFWALYVNGVSSEVGASSVLVKKGDLIEFKISTF